MSLSTIEAMTGEVLLEDYAGYLADEWWAYADEDDNYDTASERGILRLTAIAEKERRDRFDESIRVMQREHEREMSNRLDRMMRRDF